MMVAETGVSATEWQEQLTSNGEELDLRTFSQLLKKAATQQGQAATATAVLVDCTASDEVPAMVRLHGLACLFVIGPEPRDRGVLNTRALNKLHIC